MASEKNILEWGRALFPDKMPLPPCQELHQYFVDIRGEEFTNTEAPRGHAKTTIKCFLIPLFQALEEPESFKYYLNVQATDVKTLAVNRSIRSELELNQNLREIYGSMIGERWTDAQFVLKNGVIFTAVSAGQSIRGLNYRNERPAYIIVDDLYDTELDANNPEATEKKNDWFWGTLYPARAKGKRCSIHLQGTAVNREDLLEKLKKNSSVKSRTFKAIEDYATAKARVLWPQLNTMASLEKDRELMSSVIWFREMQNERRDESMSIVKGSWLVGWEYDPATLKLDGRDHRLISTMLLVDPSIGKDKEDDFTGMGVLIKTKRADSKEADYWLSHMVNEHLSLDQRVLRMQEIADRQPRDFRILKARIEAVAGFKDFAAEARRRCSGFGVEEIDVVKDKISVLESKSWFFENKKVHVSTAIPQHLRDELHYQLTVNHPRNDDLRDMLLLGLDSQPTTWGSYL